uniref:Prostaglandin E synthase 3 like n=1 Tax=Paramormyrops kingsleyae TaxID=1676925 RepID=A0A3B3RBL8_9TELE
MICCYLNTFIYLRLLTLYDPLGRNDYSGFTLLIFYSQPARVLWFDRKKYVTVNFIVQNCRDLQVDIQKDKMILSCKTEDDISIYNEIHFYDQVHIHDSRETRHDRTVHVLLRKVKENVAWPRLTKDPVKPIWLSVDFDNWRDWEHEEEEGMEEYGHYVDMLKDMSKKTEIPTMDDLDDLDDD